MILGRERGSLSIMKFMIDSVDEPMEEQNIPYESENTYLSKMFLGPQYLATQTGSKIPILAYLYTYSTVTYLPTYPHSTYQVPSTYIKQEIQDKMFFQ